MTDTIPAKLKGLQLAPFAKRAAQLERFKPIVTYWLRFYIVQRIIAGGLHSADQECTAYTTDLMEKLEQAKADHPSEDALLDDTAASAYCEQFALQTFAKGEKDMSDNKATSNTADTLLAASTFLEILSIWKKDPDPEIASKTKFAKFHALRILKAIKAHEDPNLTNPVQESQQQSLSPPVLDPSDPEVQGINQSAPSQPPQNPYQPSVETAPNTSTPPSPTFSAPKVSPPPPNLPSAPTGYTQSSHNDVSPISQPTSSRHGSVTSVGGGYFPRTDPPPPTFTAETTAPGLSTAPSTGNDPLTSSLSPDSETPQPPKPPYPSNFYQDSASSIPPLQPPQNPYGSPPPPAISPPPRAPLSPQVPQQPPVFQPSAAPPQGAYPYGSPSPQPSQPPHMPQRGAVGVFPPPTQPQPSPATNQNPYAQPAAPPPPPQQSSQGPFRDDEDSIMEAQKHAKWAISALNFEDASTAVKELRIALRALGAS
ncbi:Nn.00g055850.m01.CDS01 [Neocucurbitaria sp. VM-36]